MAYFLPFLLTCASLLLSSCGAPGSKAPEPTNVTVPFARVLTVDAAAHSKSGFVIDEAVPVVTGAHSLQLEGSDPSVTYIVSPLRKSRAVLEPRDGFYRQHDFGGWVPASAKAEITAMERVGGNLHLPSTVPNGALWIRPQASPTDIQAASTSWVIVHQGLPKLSIETAAEGGAAPTIDAVFRVKNTGQGGFVGGTMIVTVQQVVPDREFGRFRSRHQQAVPAIAAGESIELTLSIDRSELEMGSYYLHGHVLDAGVHSDSQYLTRLKSAPFTLAAPESR